MTTQSSPETVSDDGELLDAWRKQRSREAFEELVRRHMGMVHGVALRRTREPAIADDVTQSVFSLFARKASRLIPGPLAPWLHRAAIMESAKAMRSEFRHRRKLHAYALHCETERHHSADESREALLPRLDAAVDALPDRHRHILVLRFYEGLSFREIACRTGESEAAAQRRGHRALGRLEKTLRISCSALLAGMAQAGVTSVSGCSLTPSIIAVRAAVAAAVPAGFISTTIHTMHPATLMASTAAVTALILGIPLTLQMQRTGVVERGLAEALAARPAVPNEQNPAVKIAAVAAPTQTVPAAPSLPEAEIKRRADARDYAVKASGDEERRIMDRLKEHFVFTPEQEKAITAHHAQLRERRQAFVEARRLRDPYVPAFYEVEYGFHPDIPANLQSILTESQQKDYQQWEQERRTNYIEGWSGSELSFLADPLELTAEQKDQMFSKLNEIWSAYSAQDLTVLHTQSDIAAHMDTNHQNRANLFTSVLTPAQFTKWEKISLDWNRELVRRYQTPQTTAAQPK